MIGQQLREGDLLARRYLLQERIGAGGMSVIWRAWDESLQRVVAVKVLDGPIGVDRGDRELIRREARAAARIDHSSAIQVYDYGETVTSRGRLAAYVVLQLLDGESVAHRIDRDGPIRWPDAVSIAASVADVLTAAHHRGVVHRDVTPENVMLTTDGVKLLDFGIAAQVGDLDDSSALTFGTPPYVAPERLAGGKATGATDIYALGVLLYEMLTGATPYPETTWHEIEAARRDGPPPPLQVPGLPGRIGRIYELCLATDPSSRPSADQVSTELAAALARNRGTPARRQTRRRAGWMVAAAVIVGLLGSAPYVSTRLRHPDHSTGVVAAGASPEVEVLDAPTLPAPTLSVSVTPSPSVTSAPSLTPSATPSRQPPASAAAPRSVNEAAADVLDLVDRGVAAGTMRSDIAIDFKNQVTNLTFHREEYPTQIPGLRQRLRDRVREQGLTAALAQQIDAAVVQLGAVIQRDLATG